MFAENNRISHRQLMRQIVLAFAAPFLLSLPGWQNLKGINGAAGIAAGMAVLAFYVIFLVRLGPAYERLPKTVGSVQSMIIAGIYMAYIGISAAYLLDFIGRITSSWMLEGVPEFYIRLAVAAVCVLGSHRGMEKRGRMAEVSYAIVFGGILLLLVLAFLQKDHFSYGEFFHEEFQLQAAGRALYGVLCGFSALTLLPFVLARVQKSASGGRAVYSAIIILGVLLTGVLVLLPVTLGWERMVAEKTPILPLLAGTNLPGDVLARFDVIWIGLLLYGLLFSLGSLFYYSSHILEGIHFSVNHWLLGGIVFLISCNPFPGYNVSEYYSPLVLRVFTPLLIGVTLYIYLWHRRKQA